MSSPDPILALCALRKTGSVSLNQILRRQHGCAHLDTNVRFEPGTKRNRQYYRRVDLDRDRWIYPRLKSLGGHYLCPAIDYGPIGERFRWVTLLRDPVKRYLSHYGQHVEKMGETRDFETWMSIEKHHDDQVKTIAGEPDLERAKELLRTKFVIGFLECFELSLQLIRVRLPEFDLDVSVPPKRNPAKGIIDADELASKHIDRIRANNRLDQQLYDFAREDLWPRQWVGLDREELEQNISTAATAGISWSQQLRLGGARLKRFFLYKPFVRICHT
jgi:hypothetical protein